MICIENVKRFCDGDITEIPGYAEAVKSPEMWDCHHVQEIQPDGVVLDRSWMIAHKIYYKVLPCQLVFLRHGDHMALHNNHPSESRKKNHLASVNTKEYKCGQSSKSKEVWQSMHDDIVRSHNGKVFRTFGLTVKQVAEKLGIPMGSVHWKLKTGELARMLAN